MPVDESLIIRAAQDEHRRIAIDENRCPSPAVAKLPQREQGLVLDATIV
jgi:hypothetical protein